MNHQQDEAIARQLPRRIPIKLEPKAWFANERTFLAWTNMAVAFAATSSALTTLTMNSGDLDVKGPISKKTVALISMLLVPVSIVMLIYAYFVYWHRNKCMRQKAVGLFDDRVGAVLLTGLIAFLLTGITFVTYFAYFMY
jgi:uncharacterized membrane protein YidH (DUF202 family)